MSKQATAHPEILKVGAEADRIACDGTGGNGLLRGLGHPLVYYSFDGKDEVICGYCDRLFTKKAHAEAVPYRVPGAAA